jgi:hypothetical protein
MLLIIRKLCLIGRISNNKNNNYSVLSMAFRANSFEPLRLLTKVPVLSPVDRCGSKLWVATVQNYRSRIELAGWAKEFGFYTSTTVIT